LSFQELNMSPTSITFAKLAALYKEVTARLGYVPPDETFGYITRYRRLRDEVIANLPDLYDDLPKRDQPLTSQLTRTEHLPQLVRDLEYIFEVRANSELNPKDENVAEIESHPERVFISHGKSPDWREVQSYVEKDLSIETLELAQEPSRGRTVLQKLNDESDKCSFAVVVMTGDDQVGTGSPRARENVLHEIGFFQGKLGLENVCLLHEEGTSIPSNIHGLVYIPFPKGLVSAAFGVLARELTAALGKLA
jgi:predicted nucleotide-binding protein